MADRVFVREFPPLQACPTITLDEIKNRKFNLFVKKGGPESPPNGVYQYQYDPDAGWNEDPFEVDDD